MIDIAKHIEKNFGLINKVAINMHRRFPYFEKGDLVSGAAMRLLQYPPESYLSEKLLKRAMFQYIHVEWKKMNRQKDIPNLCNIDDCDIPDNYDFLDDLQQEESSVMNIPVKLKDISDDERIMFALRFRYNFEYKEIAKVFGMKSKELAEYHVKKVIKNIRTFFSRDGGSQIKILSAVTF